MRKGKKGYIWVILLALVVIVGAVLLGRTDEKVSAKEQDTKETKIVVDSVTGLKTKTESKSIVVLSWNKVANATGYKPYRRADQEEYAFVSKLKKTSCRLKIKPDVVYHYKVVAYNDKGNEEVLAKPVFCKYYCNRISLSAAGDCTLGVDSRYNNNFNNMYNRQQDPEYFLKKVKKVFDKDDLTIVNFEGTLTNSNNRADKTFTFKGKKKYTKILTSSSVEVVNMANNHTMDFGTQGYKDTKAALKNAGIKYCVGSTIAYKTVKGTKVAFLGFNGLNQISKSTIKRTINKAKSKGAKIIIASFHWGIEREYYPNASQKSYAHYAIKNGANLVLGHHPHVLQGVEEYKDSYVVYSLGNFCFGGNSNPGDKDTMIFTQDFFVDSNGKFIANANAKVIPCSLSGHSNYNDFQPKILTGEKKETVMGKIRKLSRNMGVKIKADGSIK